MPVATVARTWHIRRGHIGSRRQRGEVVFGRTMRKREVKLVKTGTGWRPAGRPRSAALTMMAMIAGMTLAGATPAPAQQAPDVPVMVGDDTPIDAASCSLGQVTGLDPQGDNFLAVRAGPGSGNAQIDALHQDDLVFVCDGDGRWLGIVYWPGHRQGSSATECGATAPISPRQPYAGPCRTGWVFDGYVAQIAG